MDERIVLPAEHFKKRVKNQYGNIPLCLCREILQNSIDAGASFIEFTTGKGTLTAHDNGSGMPLDDFRLYFLNLGGTKKQTNSIGGFGAAKELEAFAWDWWRISSRDWACVGECAANISSTPNSHTGGFKVEIRSADLDDVGPYLTELVSLSDVNIRVALNGALLSSSPTRGQKLQRLEHGCLYIADAGPRLITQCGGLYMFQDHLPGGSFVFDVHDFTALSENRESMSYYARQKLNKFIQPLAKSTEKHRKVVNTKIKLYSDNELQTNHTSHYQHGLLEFESFTRKRGYEYDLALVLDAGKTVSAADIKYAHLVAAGLNAMNVTGDVLIPGVLASDHCLATCITMSDDTHIIAVRPDVLASYSPFMLMEVLMHELAHVWEPNHSEWFELARMNRVASKIDPFKVMTIVDQVRSFLCTTK